MSQHVMVACSAAVALSEMLVRWAVAIAIAMVVTALLTRWTAARSELDSAASRESSGPVG